MTKAAAAVNESPKKKKSLSNVNMKPQKTPNKEKLKNAIANTPESMVQKGTPKSGKKQNKEKMNNLNTPNKPKEKVVGTPVNGISKKSPNKENQQNQLNSSKKKNKGKTPQKQEPVAENLLMNNDILAKLLKNQKKRLRKKSKQGGENENDVSNYIPLKLGDTKPPFTGKLTKSEKKRLQRARKAEAKKAASASQEQELMAKNKKQGGEPKGKKAKLDGGKKVGEDEDEDSSCEKENMNKKKEKSQPEKKGKKEKKGVEKDKEESEEKEYDYLRLFFGNVEFNTTEEELKTFILTAVSEDEIDTIKRPHKFGKPRSIAFLQLKTEEAYRKALTLDGKTLNGREVRVNPAKVMSPDSGRGGSFRGGFRGRGGGGPRKFGGGGDNKRGGGFKRSSNFNSDSSGNSKKFKGNSD
ncbi:histone H1-I-1, putative [Pediculus humanus corporis]|uniref:Histone H1-I-1, putative n=1 Tax=Pediculus humanus subsp. corporis TaxID=121224 RepID=E0VXN1_PEDHC|nr:histone H1-I-1, putative [Pediculus humanus corporis]EEB18137.1 histone H1-I-1, putative [Pediculus humanus corporis]